MYFVDTNIFLRHLTRDDPVKAAACFALLQAAQRNEVQLTTSESVIAEIVFILSSPRLYGLAREEIAARLRPILQLPGLKVTHRSTYLRALDLFVRYRVDFEDALTVAHMERQGMRELYSYDRDFDAVETITRHEPAHDAPTG
jgi:uncharacterized protein